MKNRYLILIFFLFGIIFSEAAIAASGKKVIAVKALTTDKQNRFDYYFYEALHQKDLGNKSAQMEALRICEQIDPENGAVQSELGFLYEELNMPEKAIDAFQKAVNASPANWWYNIQLISELSSKNRYNDAINQALLLKKLYPEKDDVYTMLASLYKRTGDYRKAIKELDQLEAYTGVNEYLSFQKFQLYVALNKDKKAMEEVDKLIEKYPMETRYQVIKGDILLQMKQNDKAFLIYQDVIAKDPTNPYVYVSLANYYKQGNQPEKALDAIVSALKNPELPADTKMDILGQYVDQMLNDKEKIAETESLFKILVNDYPLNEQTHIYYALFLQHQNRNKEALSEYESVINIDPKNSQAWLNSLNILSQAEDTTAILDLTQKALKELPETPQFYLLRSMAFYQKGELNKALETTKEALNNVDTTNVAVAGTFYAQMGDIYYEMKDKDKAFTYYEKALNTNPNNIYVMNNYAYYLSEEKKDLHKAEQMSSKTIEAEPNNSTYLDTYAWILYQEGSYSLAKFYIEKAVNNLDKKQDPSVILEHYGDILYALKDKTKALEIWNKAYKADPTNEKLKTKIDELKDGLQQIINSN